MVQRNVPTKLGHGLQADHVKTENLFHHQDVKNNRGADLKKKKMKKSGSIKRPKQPGKPPPPPLDHLSSAASPPRRSPVGKTATTPNYMKSTTSSDARKEQSQTQSQVSSSSLRRKSSDNSKLSLSYGKKATKTLARTLTKNPSFKPARASVRKCSPVVLCENLDAQRATCSSTLKDCKFPDYLSLNPGGTESEGTSTIKVCPYTYCSLNGHHHAPLPPLKCFLSARRRMIKTQRSIKLGCFSPRRGKPIGDDNLKSSIISPLTEEENKDFFIEIYSTGIDGIRSDSSIIDILPSVGGRDETAVEDQEERGLETLSDAPICDDFDTYEALDQNRDVESMDIGNTYLSEQNPEVKVDEEVSPPVLVQEESTQNVHFYELDSEASDMDWETGYHSAQHLDYDYECSPETDIEPDPEDRIINNEFIIKSDSKDWCFDELVVDEVSQESFDEESLNSDAFSSRDEGESTGSYDDMQSLNTTKTSAPVEVPVEEADTARDEENRIFFECHTQGIGNQGTGSCIVVEEETSFDNLNHKSIPNEDAIAVMGDQVSNLENSDENIITLSTVEPGKEPHSVGAPLKSTEAKCCIFHKVNVENAAKPEMEDSAMARVTAKSKKPIEESDELGPFNPRAPNFLPLEPDPEAEKVDLRHQDLDERKNAEEWMVDYALRQVVTKLGPARKRKVALLVEAFEKVMPVTKYDLHLRHSSAFDQARLMQACS